MPRGSAGSDAASLPPAYAYSCVPGNSLTGDVYYPGSPDYDSARFQWNTALSSTPCVVVYAHNEQDVSTAVQTAAHWNVPLSLRNGRHDYIGNSGGSGMVLDVSKINYVNIDTGNDLARVGGGAAFGTIYFQLWQQGYCLNGGSCPSVGVSGLASGGGVGVISRKYGMLVDSMVAARAVLSNGAVADCSAEQNPDLFWALRGGGGGNYACTTELTFRIFKIPQNSVDVFGVWDQWEAEAFGLLKLWQEWLLSPAFVADERMWCQMNITAGKLTFVGHFHGGTEMEARALMAPLLNYGTPKNIIDEPGVTFITRTPETYIGSVAYWGGCTAPDTPWGTVADGALCLKTIPSNQMGTKPLSFKIKSGYTGPAPLSDLGIATIVYFLHPDNVPPGAVAPSGVLLDSYGGAVARSIGGPTAFAHRDQIFGYQMLAYFSGPEGEAEAVAWQRAFYNAMIPHMNESAYRNYPDTDIRNFNSAYFGSLLPELIRVKTKYDPSDVFNGNIQGVPSMCSGNLPFNPECGGCVLSTRQPGPHTGCRAPLGRA
jgi:FAD/FMN-containing dehydrogenase